MLELQKFVLQQVSDDSVLFKKELLKSILWLKTNEVELLRKWVIKEYGDVYTEIIEEVFFTVETNP